MSHSRTTLLPEREIAAVTNCKLLLERLDQVLGEESRALEQRFASFHGQFTERKNQLLRDLLNVQRSCTSDAAKSELAPRSRALQVQIKRNQHLLKLHIDAVREVSSIIVDSLRQADSDGTYSQNRRT